MEVVEDVGVAGEEAGERGCHADGDARADDLDGAAAAHQQQQQQRLVLPGRHVRGPSIGGSGRRTLWGVPVSDGLLRGAVVEVGRRV